jgi:hypothetical protein
MEETIRNKLRPRSLMVQGPIAFCDEECHQKLSQKVRHCDKKKFKSNENTKTVITQLPL